MKPLTLFAAVFSIGLGAAGYAVVFADGTQSPDLPLIERFNDLIQQRFADPEPQALGMSRVAKPNSFGRFYYPAISRHSDFQPEKAEERQVIAEFESRHVEVGLYLVGAAIRDSDPAAPSYRALKGPAAMTRDTPRPAWYPPLPPPPDMASNQRALPDWKEIYPIAQRAMRSFDDGGRGFDTVYEGWTIAARPVLASQQRCVSCHNNNAIGSGAVELNQPLGGVLYAYRRATATSR